MLATVLWKDLCKMKPSVYVQAICLLRIYSFISKVNTFRPISYGEVSFQCISNVARFCCIVYSVLRVSYTLDNYT